MYKKATYTIRFLLFAKGWNRTNELGATYILPLDYFCIFNNNLHIEVPKISIPTYEVVKDISCPFYR